MHVKGLGPAHDMSICEGGLVSHCLCRAECARMVGDREYCCDGRGNHAHRSSMHAHVSCMTPLFQRPPPGHHGIVAVCSMPLLRGRDTLSGFLL